MDNLNSSVKLGNDIIVNIDISGEQKDNIIIQFNGIKGMLGTLNLNNTNRSFSGELRYINQRLKIYNIRSNFPHIMKTGEIILRCKYSNFNGTNWVEFNDVLFVWLL